MKARKWLAVLLTGLLAVFFAFANACETSENKLTFLCPDGAPAIAAYALREENLNITVYPSASAVGAIGQSLGKKEADFAVLPLTAASKFVAKNGYKIMGVVTHGNLYGVGAPVDSVADLKGKTIGVLQLHAVPGYTLRAVLTDADVPFTLTESDKTTENAYLYAISSPDEAVAALSAGKADVCLVAEPAVSALERKGVARSFDLQALYGGGFPQAVLVAKEQVLNTQADLARRIASALTQYDATAQSAQRVVDFINARIEGGSSLKAEALTPTALAGCHIFYASAMEQKQKITDYIAKIKAFDSALGSVAEYLPDSAYWEAE